MFLDSLFLTNFRNHRQSKFTFDQSINLISGQNGSGKTNLLEAIHVLSTGHTFLSHSLPELITWKQSYSLIQGQVGELPLEVQFQIKPESGLVNRVFKINNSPKTRAKYLGQLRVVVFQPDDLHLITGSPTRRRAYLDDVLSSLHWQYHQAKTAYSKALSNRNQLLDLVYQNQAQPDELQFWNQELIKHSKTINYYRHSFLSSQNTFFSKHPFPEINSLNLNYDSTQITTESLAKNYFIDLRRGSTQVGPHRDDWFFKNEFFKTESPLLTSWASRGQQRLAILALKLGEINYIQTNLLQKPILLLDDIFSELDQDHRHLVVEICKQHQSFITSAEPSLSPLLPVAKHLAL